MRLVEFAPLTLSGSFHRSLIFNKLWLLSELEKIKDHFGTIYILGSWYGNMSLLLARSSIDYEHIVNVDRDAEQVRTGQAIAKKMGVADRIEAMTADVNTLDYRQLDNNGLVINTSCHDIENTGWFDHIPKGTMVALQSRTDVDDDLSDYKISKLLYQGSRELEDPETKYTSILEIGIK
jgi:SAM-dependent methyltransferase